MPHIVHCNRGNHKFFLTKVPWATQLLVIKASFSCCEKRGRASYWLDCSKWLQVWYLCRKGAQPDLTQFCKGPECMCQNSSNWRRLNNSITAIASMTSIYTAFLQLTKQFLHHNEWSLNRSKNRTCRCTVHHLPQNRTLCIVHLGNLISCPCKPISATSIQSEESSWIRVKGRKTHSNEIWHVSKIQAEICTNWYDLIIGMSAIWEHKENGNQLTTETCRKRKKPVIGNNALSQIFRPGLGTISRCPPNFKFQWWKWKALSNYKLTILTETTQLPPPPPSQFSAGMCSTLRLMSVLCNFSTLFTSLMNNAVLHIHLGSSPSQISCRTNLFFMK